jgi:hypothetical protein
MRFRLGAIVGDDTVEHHERDMTAPLAYGSPDSNGFDHQGFEVLALAAEQPIPDLTHLFLLAVSRSLAQRVVKSAACPP